MLTCEELKRLLHYDPETGLWTWAFKNHRHELGDPAGCPTDSRGYIKISFRLNGVLCSYLAHQLAWFYMTGAWVKFIDHKDLDKGNNRWANLREATKAQNAWNTPPRVREAKGASFIKKIGRYRAQICVNGRRVHLGYTETAEQAQELYRVAAEKYHGEFARAR